MRILVLTRYERLGSSSRVRFYQYFPYLESHGLEIVSAPFFTDEYVRNLYSGQKASLTSVAKAYITRLANLLKSRTFDLLWVEKELIPWFPVTIEELLKAHDTPCVVDYDDAVFHRYDMHPNLFLRTFLGHKIDKVMQHATLVVAGNEYLAKRAIKAGAPSVEYLPSVVDVGQYAVKQPTSNSIFRIGWIGSPVTAPYLNLISEAVSILNREAKIKLILVGAGSHPISSEIPTEMINWNEDIELNISQKFDVGIMPLVDGPFERGKCGYKLIQYMAGGLPVVASPVGVNQQIVEKDLNGYLANSVNDWLIALRTLRDHPQKRIAMGMAGRQKAENIYNLQVTAPKLLDFLNRAATKPHA